MPNDKLSQKPPDIVVAMDHEGTVTVNGEPVAFDDVISVVKRKQEEYAKRRGNPTGASAE